MQGDPRLAGAFPGDLDLLPSNSASAGAKRFHHRLFRREPGGELRGPSAAVGDLTGGVYTLQEPVAEAGKGRGHAVDLDDVHTDRQVVQGGYASGASHRIMASLTPPLQTLRL